MNTSGNDQIVSSTPGNDRTSSSTSGDVQILFAGLRAAGARPVRFLVAAGILFSASLLVLLLLCFPGPGLRPLETLRALRRSPDPALFHLFLITAAVLLWAVWSALGGAVMRAAGGGIAGRPLPGGSILPMALRRWSSHFGAPVALLLSVAVLLGFATGILQVVRIPWVGWPLLAILSPVVLALAGGGLWLLIRWLASGHLVGAAIAAEETGAYGGLGRALAHLRADPLRVLGLRALALLFWLLAVIRRAGLGLATVLLAGLLLRLTAPDLFFSAHRALTGGIGLGGGGEDVAAISLAVLGVLLASWVLSAPISLLFGARAALYLVHRRRRDGVAVDASAPGREREKSLEELGIEIVQSLRGDPEIEASLPQGPENETSLPQGPENETSLPQGPEIE